MNISSTSTTGFVPANASSPATTVKRKSSSSLSDTHGSNTLYDSALDNLSDYSSPNDESSNNNNNLNINRSYTITTAALNSNNPWNQPAVNTSASDLEATLGASNKSNGIAEDRNASAQFIQSEGGSTLRSSTAMPVDNESETPRAEKTLPRPLDPNTSIIEISDNSSVEADDLARSIVVIGSSSSDDDEELTDESIKANTTVTAPSILPPTHSKANLNSSTPTANASGSGDAQESTANSAEDAEKRRRKPESLIHSSKQKLNVAIAEASAAESRARGDVALIGGDSDKSHGIDYPATKRPIQIYDSLEEFEQNLPATVTVLETPFGSKVYLVGTAHFSEDSQDDVSYVMRNVRPDVVMVELCPSRVHILKLDERTLLEETKSLNMAKFRTIIETHGLANGIFFIMLLQMNAQIAKELGMAPGGEFRRAFGELRRLPHCMLHLGDRPINITLQRALRALTWWQTLKLMVRLASNESVTIEEVEECKQVDLLEKLMQEMAGEFPTFSEVFVKERDLFLCHSLQMAALPQMSSKNPAIPLRPVNVVGVVGIGHASGIAKLWGKVDPQKIPPIMEIPPTRTSTRIMKYTLKYGLISLVLFGAFRVLRPRVSRLF